MASSSSPQALKISLPTGPLGVTVQNQNGNYIVTSKTDSSNSPLEVNDVIVSLNGIKLVDVEGGMNAIVQLFLAFGAGERNLVVQRGAAGVSTSAAAAPSTVSGAKKKKTASTGAKKAATAPSAASKPSAKKAPAIITQPYSEEQRKKQLGCNFSSQDSIKPLFPNIKGRGTLTPLLPQIQLFGKKKAGVLPIRKHPSYSSSNWREESKKLGKKYDEEMKKYEVKRAKAMGKYVREWRMLSQEQQVQYKKTGGNAHNKCKPLPKPAPSTDLARVENDNKKKHALKDSTKQNATKKQKTDSKKTGKNKTKSKKDDFTHDIHYMKLIENGFPEYYGLVSPCQNYYVAKTNDCYSGVADKVGLDDWKALNRIEFNTKFYGQLNANTQFQRGTIIKIPTMQCSKWKLSKLVNNQEEEMKVMATCAKCLKKEQPNDMDEMLMCDGCDAEMHTRCAGLTSVPEGDWLCGSCLEILEARKESMTVDCPKDAEGRRSLEAKVPSLPKLDAITLHFAEQAHRRFREEVTSKKVAALARLEENQRVLAESSRERIANLTNEVQTMISTVNQEKQNYDSVKRRTFARHGVTGWSIKNIGRSHIQFRRDDGTIGTVYRTKAWNYSHGMMRTTEQCPQWNRYHHKQQECQREVEALPEKMAYENAKNQLESVKEDLNQAKSEERDRPASDEEDRRTLLLEFAKHLSEPKHEFETQKVYQSRAGCDPIFLGVVKVSDDLMVRVLNVLREPTELVLSIPVNSNMISIDVEPVESGEEYYLFGTAELFCPKRNDYLPMDFSPTSVRTAQRDLMAMLRRDARNNSFQVSKPSIPSSVSLRGTSEETLSDVIQCFDLSELVRDCHYPIQNQPAAETPKMLADNGLVLRDYQKTSLQWLIDKETNSTGLGSSGELWSRMRGLTGGTSADVQYFYCELSGSFLNEIFDYNSDVDQKDASKPCGDQRSSAIIGSEMGLGKTVIALSLVVASPPALKNRVLVREHVAKINHPAYLPPPSAVQCTSSNSKTSFVSNATLVIAPMTLCPQWQAEIQRFAPWMSFVTLHNEETDSVASIASKDIVVVSTFMMSQPSGRSGALLRKLKQIHFHRIFLDESHYNNTGERVKQSLSQLSATHRYCVTGTPVGRSLADLYGQLRFLRVPQFCRPDFWQHCIDQPYSEHNFYALNVLRSLLSRMVIRHSKEQTLDDGNALVTLPPRTVETLLLPFGSDSEKHIYEYIETRNTQRFMDLRSDSPATVLSKYIDLTGMLYSARLACAHASLVNLDSLQNLNVKLQAERCEKLGHGKAEQEKKKNKSATRADIFQEAISKARPSAQGRMREAVSQFQEGEIELMECPVCLEPTGEKDIALTPCAHKFCAECILSCLSSLSSSREPTGACPECRETIKRSELTFLGDANDAGQSISRLPEDDQKPKANGAADTDVDINGFHLSTKDTTVAAASGALDHRTVRAPLTDSEMRQQRSFCHTLPPEFLTSWNIGHNAIGTKVARLLEEIKCMIQNDPTAKAVVFSQFLGTLDVAGQEIAARGIGVVRVDGMMKQYQRADAIESFTKDANTRVLLLSMRAGAAGLNLMAANHCFLLEPTLNSAVEEQAIDRIHRIGQTRPVFVKRLIIKGTIEERILDNRRSLAADRPTSSTQLDGTAGLMEEGEHFAKQSKKRDRHEDENHMGEKTFQRLRQMESLFGCSATVKVTKA